MNDIRELIEQWRNPSCSGFRKDSPEYGAEWAKKECADQLEVAMPVGTIITEDESTKPPDGCVFVILRFQLMSGRWSKPEFAIPEQTQIGDIWWPADGMFEPPEDK